MAEQNQQYMLWNLYQNLETLLERANAGDQQAIAQLRKFGGSVHRSQLKSRAAQ